MFETGNAFTLYQDPLADAIVQSFHVVRGSAGIH
jgi:hypothetical protein